MRALALLTKRWLQEALVFIIIIVQANVPLFFISPIFIKCFKHGRKYKQFVFLF